MTPLQSSLIAMIVLLGAAVAAMSHMARDELAVYAAGRLRAAMTDLARAFERAASPMVKLTLGPSGLLKRRIEGGGAAQVFGSVNMNHPETLRASGKAEAVLPSARSALCALGSSAFALQGKTLAHRLLDIDARVGTSTPRADPAVDYAFQVFEHCHFRSASRTQPDLA